VVALNRELVGCAVCRNILVHGYAEVDPEVVKDVVEHHLGDLDAFVSPIRARLSP
jgi:uncharacterized protein YutE (UPF0331/DUF86 family)